MVVATNEANPMIDQVKNKIDTKVCVEVVAEFPLRPEEGMAYSLAGAKREDVVRGTHVSHKYPAKFIPQIPQWALKNHLKIKHATVLDPFCGSGTTLVEAGRLGHKALGCDISPLAALISRAKCSVISENHLEMWRKKLSSLILEEAIKLAPRLTNDLREAVGQEIYGLHYTWSNWFEPEGAAGILAIRQAIEKIVSDEPLRSCLLTVLSSIIKSCSYLNEDQIKVRFDSGKKLVNPFEIFPRIANQFLEKQYILSNEFSKNEAKFDIQIASASALPFLDGSVDAIVTSPPYINAVDYTMAHKYNLFLLNLLDPAEFKSHCRDYIGVTERAVRAADIASRPVCKVPEINSWVAKLDAIGTPTSANRSFVVTQYFNGMYESFLEAHRVMRSGGNYVMIIGESNRICGIDIPTADLIGVCAEAAGFSITENFLHALANRSAMRLSRSSTGGEIPFERVFVFLR